MNTPSRQADSPPVGPVVFADPSVSGAVSPAAPSAVAPASVSSQDASAPDRVYASLKRRIIAGQVRGGDMLSEKEIAEDAGVSRTPVREALLRLQAEGLVRVYPKRGVMVEPIADGEFANVFDARVLIESHAFEAIAEQPRSKRGRAIEQAKAQLSAQDAALEAGDLDAYAACDALFHEALVNAGGNALLTAFFRSVRERQERLIQASVGRDLDRARAFCAEHHRMVGFLAEGDASAAIALLNTHLESAKEMLA